MQPLKAPRYSRADCILRAWDVTFEGINRAPITRRIYATVKQLQSAAVEACQVVARMIGQSPMALSVTVREV